MEVAFAPKFIRAFRSLPVELQNEAYEKIDLFKEVKNHHSLKVHKLTGKLADRFSFSVNYQTRIVFKYIKERRGKSAVLLMIGDHDVYR